MRKKFILLLIIALVASVLFFAFKDKDKKTTEETKQVFSYEELSNMALDYFMANNSNQLAREEYQVGISEEVIPKYENQNMVVIEIRHINGMINSLDERYFINIYTAKGFDMMEKEIDLNKQK